MKDDALLLTFSFVTYMQRKEHVKLDGKYHEFSEEIEKVIAGVAAKFDLRIEGYQDSIYVLGGGLTQDNSGQCVICNEWVSAQNRKNIIDGLDTGAEFKGKFYCDHHLPKESPFYKNLYRTDDT